MWLQALELSRQAEQLHRRFVRYLGPGPEQLRWEPPVDVEETPEGYVLLFALPGVRAEDIELSVDGRSLTVSAQRAVQLSSPQGLIRRLEIPHGHFLRRVALPAAFRVLSSTYGNGCLQVHLTRIE